MTGAAILSSLGGIPSGPAGFRTFRLERISETRATLTGWKEKLILGAFVSILTTLAWKLHPRKRLIRTDSLIVGDVKYSLTDALLSGTILPFSSKQIKLVLTLDLLFGRSDLSFSQNKPGEHLEQTHAASKQKSLTDSLFRAVTLFRWHLDVSRTDPWSQGKLETESNSKIQLECLLEILTSANRCLRKCLLRSNFLTFSVDISKNKLNDESRSPVRSAHCSPAIDPFSVKSHRTSQKPYMRE